MVKISMVDEVSTRWLIGISVSVSWSICGFFGFKVLGFGFDDIGYGCTFITVCSRERHSLSRCICIWTWDEMRQRLADKVNWNGPHKHKGTADVTSLRSRFQDKSYKGNSEPLVTVFGDISGCRVLVWN